ncbi:MAG: hypothetical protein ACWA5P_02075 [bacterium]
MYQVTYMSLKGEIKQVQCGGDTPSKARILAETIYNDCAKTLFVTNIYSGEVEG